MDEQKTAVRDEIAIVDERAIRGKIYAVRDVKVMLDFELAEIYGYTTSAFNQQVKRNQEKFPDDFRFQLTKAEFQNLLSQNVTASWGGDRRAEPWAFTESGIYMLMTVLKGELATRQSIALIRILQEMKNYINDTQGLASQRDVLRLSIQTTENTEAIRNLQSAMTDQQKLLADQQKAILAIDDQLMDAREQLNEMVKKSDLSPAVLMVKIPEDTKKEYLLRDGQPAKADVTYIDIYSKATQSVYIIDNYVNIKTLRLLQDVKPGVKVTVFSDNLRNQLHASDEADFRVEFPAIQMNFITTGGIMHDRFIVLDYDTADERFYHCGASSKDAAVKLTTAITEITSQDMKAQMHKLIDQMKQNPPLVLR